MKAIFDTSSLLAFVRYYLPFDKNGKLKNFIKTKFDGGELLVLDKVIEQAKFVSKGIIIQELDFIDNKVKIINTANVLPYPKFYNLLENQFCNKDVLSLRNLTETEFEQAKNEFLDDADAKLLLYSLSIKRENPIIVTEETASANDNKIFRKIPDCCSHINIECCSLPVVLKNHFSLDLDTFL